MRMPILVSKRGGTFTTREEASKNSASGEQGETEGLLRRLAADPTLRVVFFGKWRGGGIPGVEVVTSSTRGLIDEGNHVRVDGGPDQRGLHALDAERIVDLLGGERPACIVEVAGYSPTMSMIDNPNGSSVQVAAAIYSAPVLGVTHLLGLPRFVVNNDPRTYPRDQEMSLGWPNLRPLALLDQCDDVRPQVVGGRRYLRTSVHAHCESWGYIPRVAGWEDYDWARKSDLCNVVAHAHVKDGCKVGMGRSRAWQRVLGGGVPEGTHVWGGGWEGSHETKGGWRDWSTEAEVHGKIRPDEVVSIFARTLCTPVVAMDYRFYTGKPYLTWSQRCFPLFFGREDSRDEPHCWDPKAEIVPLDHWSRVDAPGDLADVARRLDCDEASRRELRELYDERLVPRWETLDRLLECARSAYETGGVEEVRARAQAREWRRAFGGYEPAA